MVRAACVAPVITEMGETGDNEPGVYQRSSGIEVAEKCAAVTMRNDDQRQIMADRGRFRARASSPIGATTDDIEWNGEAMA